MRKLILSISIFCLFVMLVSFSGTQAGKAAGSLISFQQKLLGPVIFAKDLTSSLYHMLDLEEKGLSKEAFDYAYKGYLKLIDRKKIINTGYLTICDFSQSSRKKRLYIVDLVKNTVVVNTYVAHGKNSGTEYATRFSNKPESLQSSLGFYITGQTYNGEHGLSLRMEGMEAGINDKALGRGIVIHGADYIGGNKAGRSFGCPAVPKEESTDLINTIKNGTCVFIYHPSKKYLLQSKILNG